MRRLLPLLLLLPLANSAQNIFKNKLEGCQPQQFCLDCGSPKASFKQEEFGLLLNALSQEKALKNGGGQSIFQVIVDTVGNACVISYDGQVTPKQAKVLATKLTEFKGWTPAIETNGKPTNASIAVVFDLSGPIRAGIHRIDLSARDNMNNPGTPEIKNKKYKYRNEHLRDYEFTVWNKANSDIPYDMSRAITVDTAGVVWHGTDNALVRFEGGKMEVLDKTNSIFKTDYKLMTVSAAATDRSNKKYFDANDNIYTYDGREWQVLDSATIGIKGALDIEAAPNGKVLLSAYNGLLIIDKENRTFLTSQNSKLPEDRVLYANYDSKDRLWVGTYSGSIMIEPDGKVTEFNSGETPLQHLAISDLTEDRDGTLWFATYDYDKKATEKLVKLDGGGNWTYYDISNSGLPENHINKVLSNNTEDILWLTVHNVGLVRFDKKEGWEVYTNQNSGVPSTYIFDVEQDKKGNLWCATFSGLLRVSKK